MLAAVDWSQRRMQSYHTRKRKNKPAIAKDGGMVRHSGWHATFKQREADILAGRVSANSHKEAEEAGGTVGNAAGENSFVQLKKKRTVFDRDEEKTDLMGYLSWLTERTSKLEQDVVGQAGDGGIQPSNSILQELMATAEAKERKAKARRRPHTALGGESPSVAGKKALRRPMTSQHQRRSAVVNGKGKNRRKRIATYDSATRAISTAMMSPGGLQTDEFGLPTFSNALLRDEPPSFDEQVDVFLDRFVKKKMQPNAAKCIQAWTRSVLRRKKFLKWKRRRIRRTLDTFQVWKLSWKYRQLCKKSKVRRYWSAWKEDHDDLKATKRLLEKAMSKEAKKSRQIVANLLFGGSGMAAGSSDQFSEEHMKMMEEIRLEAKRQTKIKSFQAWVLALEAAKVTAERAKKHLQRVMRSLESQTTRYMWPIERCALMLRLWRRVCRFQKFLRNGGEGIPDFKDLPQMDEWDKWLANYERWQIIYFKADTLAPLVLMRRYLVRMQLFVQNKHEDRQKERDAIKHYRDQLCSRCLLMWKIEAKNRGRNMRKLRKIMYMWLAWSKRESELKRRERLISTRIHDRTLGDVLMQWRWRRNAHAMVVSTGVHFLLQSSAKYNLLYAIFHWKGDKPHCVMMRCWRQWTKFASRRVLWNRYLFQYRRRVARNLLGKYVENWRRYADRRVEAREKKKRFMYNRQKDSNGDGGDDYDEEPLTDEFLSEDEDQDERPQASSSLPPSAGQNWSLEWRRRSKNADSKLRGLQEGALPEDRLDETVMRRMLINTNEIYAGGAEGNEALSLVDRGGNTPLHIACGRGDTKKVQELIKEGWSVNATNHCYETPLHCAARHLPLMFLPIVVHLLECGASIDMEDMNGKTPIDLAINPQISFLLRRHRQRMENFEFTSKERQWYRKMRISQWSSVNHTELWQEVVHLYLLQKRISNMDRDRLGDSSAGAAGASGRPHSRRSRAGGMSDARMERIRRIQKGAHVLGGEKKDGDESDPTKVAADQTGWYSPRCPNNQWSSRYHRALAFLRTRKALENSGFQSLMFAQVSKRKRRMRRMKRRLERDKVLLANAYLRQTVMEYEKSAKELSYIRGPGHDSDGDESDGSGADDESEDDGHSDGSSEEEQGFSEGGGSVVHGGLEGVSVPDSKTPLMQMPSMTDIGSRPGTAADASTLDVPLVTTTNKKKARVVDGVGAAYGMVLPEANKIVGDSLRWDTDEDSDMDDDVARNLEGLFNESSSVDIGSAKDHSTELKWDENDDGEVDDVDEDDNDDMAALNVNVTYVKSHKKDLANDVGEPQIKFSTEQDVHSIRFGLEKKLAALGTMDITVTMGIHNIPRSNDEIDRLESIARPGSSNRPNSSNNRDSRPNSRGSDGGSNGKFSIEGMDPAYFSQLKKAHSIALNRLDAERNDLDRRWDTCDAEIQQNEAKVIVDKQDLESLLTKREAIAAELNFVIRNAKKEVRQTIDNLKRLKSQSYALSSKIEEMTEQQGSLQEDLNAKNSEYALVRKRRSAPEKIKKAQKAKDAVMKKMETLTKTLNTAQQQEALVERKIEEQTKHKRNVQSKNQKNTQVHLNHLAEVDKQAVGLQDEIKQCEEQTSDNVRELQSLEMQIGEVKIEQGKQQFLYNEAERSEAELMQGAAGSRYRRYGTTTPPSTPPLSRGSMTALTMVLEEPIPDEKDGPQSPPRSRESSRKSYYDDDDDGIIDLDDKDFDLDEQDAESKSKESGAQKFLLAPPKRKRPPISNKEWKKEANHALSESIEEVQKEEEEKADYDAKMKVLRSEHNYLNTPPTDKRKLEMKKYNQSLGSLFEEERGDLEDLAQRMEEEKEKKRVEDAKEDEKKKKKEKRKKAMEGQIDIFAAQNRRNVKKQKKLAAKRKAAEAAESRGEVLPGNNDQSSSDSDDEWIKGWKDDVIYAQLQADKKDGNYADEDETKAEKIDKSNYFFGNFGVMLPESEEQPDESEPPFALDEGKSQLKEANKSTKLNPKEALATDSVTGSLDHSADGFMEEGDPDPEIDFSDEEPVDWRASERPPGIFQVNPRPDQDAVEEFNKEKWLLGSSISVREADNQGLDPLLVIARDSGKHDGLARGDGDKTDDALAEPEDANMSKTEAAPVELEDALNAENSPGETISARIAESGKQQLKSGLSAKVTVSQVPTPNNLQVVDRANSIARPRTAPTAIARSPDARSSEAANLMFGNNISNVRPNTAASPGLNVSRSLPDSEAVENMEIEAWDESVESQGLIIQPSMSEEFSIKEEDSVDKAKKADSTKIEPKKMMKIHWHDTINARAMKKKELFKQKVKKGLERALEFHARDEVNRKITQSGAWARMPVPDASDGVETYARKILPYPAHPTEGTVEEDIIVRPDPSIPPGRFVLSGSNHFHKPLSHSFVVKSMNTPGMARRMKAQNDFQNSIAMKMNDEAMETPTTRPNSAASAATTALGSADFMDSLSQIDDERDAWDSFFDHDLAEHSSHADNHRLSGGINSLEVVGFGPKKMVNEFLDSRGSYFSKASPVVDTDSTNKEETIDRVGQNYSGEGQSAQIHAADLDIQKRASTAPASPVKQPRPVFRSQIERPSSSSFRLEGSKAEDIVDYLRAVKANVGDPSLDPTFERAAEQFADALGVEMNRGEMEVRRKRMNSRSRSRGKALNSLQPLAGLKPLMVNKQMSTVSSLGSGSMVISKPKKLPLLVSAVKNHLVSDLDRGSSSLHLTKPNLSIVRGGGRHRSSHANISTNVTSAILQDYIASDEAQIKSMPKDSESNTNITAADVELIESKKKYANFARTKAKLYLEGDGLLKPLNAKHLSNGQEAEDLRKARHEIWDRYKTRPMSTAMQAAYAELYPDVYGKLAPATEQLLVDSGHVDPSHYEHQSDQAEAEQYEFQDEMVNNFGNDEYSKVVQREQEALAENKALEKELKRLNDDEDEYINATENAQDESDTHSGVEPTRNGSIPVKNDEIIMAKKETLEEETQRVLYGGRRLAQESTASSKGSAGLGSAASVSRAKSQPRLEGVERAKVENVQASKGSKSHPNLVTGLANIENDLQATVDPLIENKESSTPEILLSHFTKILWSGLPLHGKEVTTLKSFFKAVDRNRDGLVSASELSEAVLAAGLQENQSRSFMTLFDWDDNGFIDFNRFTKTLKKHSTIDITNSGYVHNSISGSDLGTTSVDSIGSIEEMPAALLAVNKIESKPQKNVLVNNEGAADSEAIPINPLASATGPIKAHSLPKRSQPDSESLNRSQKKAGIKPRKKAKTKPLASGSVEATYKPISGKEEDRNDEPINKNRQGEKVTEEVWEHSVPTEAKENEGPTLDCSARTIQAKESNDEIAPAPTDGTAVSQTTRDHMQVNVGGDIPQEIDAVQHQTTEPESQRAVNEVPLQDAEDNAIATFPASVEPVASAGTEENIQNSVEEENDHEAVPTKNPPLDLPGDSAEIEVVGNAEHDLHESPTPTPSESQGTSTPNALKPRVVSPPRKKMPWETKKFGLRSEANILVQKTKQINKEFKEHRELQEKREAELEAMLEAERIMAEQEKEQSEHKVNLDSFMGLLADSENVDHQYDSKRRTNLMKHIQLGRRLGEIMQIRDDTNRKKARLVMDSGVHSNNLHQLIKAQKAKSKKE